MIRFLRLFPAFVHLETRVQELESQAVILQQRALAAEAARDDLRKVTDAAWRAVTGKGIFGVSAVDLGAAPPQEFHPPVERRQTARDCQREANRQAIDAFLQMATGQPEKSSLDDFFNAELSQ